MDIASESEYKDRQKEFITKVQSLEPRLVNQADQTLLLTHIMQYLHKYSANAYEINQTAYSSNVKERSRILKELGYPVTLELSLSSLDFSEHKDIDTENKVMLCLTLTAQGRTINDMDNQVIATEKARERKCKQLEEWLPDGEVEAASSKLYSSLSQEIVDELLFIYKKPGNYTTAPSPIRPKVVLEEQWEKPERLKEFRTASNAPFTVVSTTPSFEWSAIEGAGITDVKYDFRLYSGKIGYTTIKNNELIYSRDDLISNTYKIDTPLDNCSWYLWTVRATFKLYGNPRVTDWSKIKNPNYSRSFFPIRTPASEDRPGCWNTFVDRASKR